MRAFGNSPRMAMIASMPPISGICKSIKVTSWGASLWVAQAFGERAASATNCMSGSVPIKSAIPSRRSGWSSTIRTRIDFQRLVHVLPVFRLRLHSGEPVWFALWLIPSIILLPEQASSSCHV